MRKLDFLKDIISKQAILPRYYEESIEYLNIHSLDKIAFPMICFCDINFSKIESHVEYYGEYGIGFDKEWGIEKGIQPIHYVNENSYLKKEISYLFNKSLNSNNEEEDNFTNEYNSYLLNHVLYMKPVMGKMRRDKGYDPRNFTDEREWRFIPKIEERHNLQLIIPTTYVGNDNLYNSYSKGISTIDELWLTFQLKDIKYLMVKSDSCRDELIEFILSLDNINQFDQYVLISKILVYEIMRKDW